MPPTVAMPVMAEMVLWVTMEAVAQAARGQVSAATVAQAGPAAIVPLQVHIMALPEAQAFRLAPFSFMRRSRLPHMVGLEVLVVISALLLLPAAVGIRRPVSAAVELALVARLMVRPVVVSPAVGEKRIVLEQ